MNDKNFIYAYLNFEYDFITGSCSSFPMFFGEKLLVRLLKEEGVETGGDYGKKMRAWRYSCRGDGVGEISLQYKWLGM